MPFWGMITPLHIRGREAEVYPPLHLSDLCSSFITFICYHNWREIHAYAHSNNRGKFCFQRKLWCVEEKIVDQTFVWFILLFPLNYTHLLPVASQDKISHANPGMTLWFIVTSAKDVMWLVRFVTVLLKKLCTNAHGTFIKDTTQAW